MLNNHEANLTDEEAAAEVARVAKIYPVVRLMSADQVKSERNCLLAGDRCPCLRQSSLEALATSDEISERLLNDGVEYRARVRSLTVEGEPHVLLMVRPIDEQEVAEEDLVYTDVLTSVRNRRYYEEKLRSARMNAGVAMIDLDDFRVFNDTCGRHAGDLALGAVAAAIRGGIRSTDELVRLGCDKFVAVMPNIPSDDFARRLRHVSDAVHATIVPGHEHVSLTACVGGVRINGETVDEGVNRAVQLLSHAKAKPGTVVTDSDAIEIFQSEKPSVLIVDDSEMNRIILNEMLKDEYRVLEADNGRTALDLVDRYGDELSLVLLDIIMPGMNGFEVLGELSRRTVADSLPVIMISSEDSDDVVLRAYELGASDYINRPFNARVVRRRVSNTIRLYAKQRRLTSLLSQQYNERVKNSRMLIDIMAGVMELRNGESGLHVTHIEKLTELLLGCLVHRSDKFPLDNEQRSTIAMASALHDIGKMSIDDAILNKPGRLTSEEFEIMKTHTTLGADMLFELGHQHAGNSLLEYAYQIARWHHERWDGKGYPDGLKGDEIPIAAQVVSVADVYDALTSVRVYKDAIPHQEAIQMILDGKCGEFNPLLLDCLLEVQDRIAETLARPADVVAFPTI
ncbi:response regulator [Collinsella aerofaciens]|uniref:diguanylate cyclase n=1 Tax=Collinsella aerofaciens TaxID=74426 RepID=UPI001C380E4B|nr:HD domain-containing phosphohydrolase [Collinsella aerofaciens]MBV4181175.1 response regulator [Collinsella aerofaciens]MBV4193322.1 response regulator [Collinsella aerofaciens]